MAEPAPPREGRAPDEAPADASALVRPASCTQLFWAFTRLALQGFGGVLPVAHHELVERQRWLRPEEFVAQLALAQVLPGPNIVNLALMLGDRWFGLRGALAASAGLLLLPLAVVLLLAALYQSWRELPEVAAALRGMGAVAAGLVVATALKLARTLHGSPLGRPAAWALAAATLIGVGGLRWPLLWVVLGLGGPAMAWAALRLRRAGQRPQ